MFVIVPVRFVKRHSDRKLERREVETAVEYFREMGAMMKIQHIPETYEDFEIWYEKTKVRGRAHGV